MKIRIQGLVAGKPAYCECELPEVKWHASDASVTLPANAFPDSIYRIDLVSDDGSKAVTKR